MNDSVNEHLSILVVDDVGSMRALLIAILRELGYLDITAAASGEEACKLVENQRFDLILCDWDMPGLSGLDVLNVLRETYSEQELPFIMVTAEDGNSSVKEAIAKGVSDYIIKPFAPVALQSKIDRVTREHAL